MEIRTLPAALMRAKLCHKCHCGPGAAVAVDGGAKFCSKCDTRCCDNDLCRAIHEFWLHFHETQCEDPFCSVPYCTIIRALLQHRYACTNPICSLCVPADATLLCSLRSVRPVSITIPK